MLKRTGNMNWRDVLHLLISLLLILDAAHSAENICHHCHCQRSSVVCHYGHNRTLSNVWDNKYFVPANVTSIFVQLNGDTSFEFHKGCLQSNRVNSFIIQGKRDGNDQVELTSHAFQSNQAGYPDVQVRDVYFVFLRRNVFKDSELKFTALNSEEVYIDAHAFNKVNSTISFKNIGNLKIKAQAFRPTDNSAQPRMRLDIHDSYIGQILPFDVSLNEISLINCHIGTITSGAMHVTSINAITIENCRIEKIETGALSSKLLSETVLVNNNTIGVVESKAIDGSGVSMLNFTNNSVDQMHSDAIIIHSATVNITDNHMAHVEKNWLKVHNCEQINMIGNYFENFVHIQINECKKCAFAKNTMKSVEQESLNFTTCHVHENKVKTECRCDRSWKLLSNHDYSAEIYCKLPKYLQSCFNETTTSVRKYEKEVCHPDQTTGQCKDGSSVPRPESENPTNWSILNIVTLSIVIGVLVVILICSVSWMNQCTPTATSHHDNEQQPMNSNSNETSTAASAPELHIYSEPSVTQKPQLNNDYSIVQNQTIEEHIYTDPVNIGG